MISEDRPTGPGTVVIPGLAADLLEEGGTRPSPFASPSARPANAARAGPVALRCRRRARRGRGRARGDGGRAPRGQQPDRTRRGLRGVPRERERGAAPRVASTTAPGSSGSSRSATRRCARTSSRARAPCCATATCCRSEGRPSASALSWAGELPPPSRRRNRACPRRRRAGRGARTVRGGVRRVDRGGRRARRPGRASRSRSARSAATAARSSTSRAADVRIRQDGADLGPDAVTSLERVDEAGRGVAVAIALDNSRTLLGEPFERARAQALAFVAKLAPPDQAALVSFSGQAQVVVPFGQPLEEVRARIEGLAPDRTSMTTAVFDGIHRAAELAAHDADAAAHALRRRVLARSRRRKPAPPGRRRRARARERRRAAHPDLHDRLRRTRRGRSARPPADRARPPERPSRAKPTRPRSTRRRSRRCAGATSRGSRPARTAARTGSPWRSRAAPRSARPSTRRAEHAARGAPDPLAAPAARRRGGPRGRRVLALAARWARAGAGADDRDRRRRSRRRRARRASASSTGRSPRAASTSSPGARGSARAPGTTSPSTRPRCRAATRRSAARARNWTIVDLGSTNGTRVNGNAVKSARLRSGDRIRLGEVELVFEA